MDHKGSTLTIDKTDGSLTTPSPWRLFLLALGVAALLLAAAVIFPSLLDVESNPAPELTGGITADTVRWEAMGEFYVAKTAEVERGAAASAARWVAMGEQYTGKAFYGDADAARWEAMGGHYAAKAAEVARGAAASAARWVAMGEHYAQ